MMKLHAAFPAMIWLALGATPGCDGSDSDSPPSGPSGSSGPSGPSGDAPADGDEPPDMPPNSGVTNVSMLPGGVGAPDIKVGPDGTLHAAFALVVEGAVLYTSCRQDCHDAGAWRSVLAVPPLPDFSSIDAITVNLELTPAGAPRLGVLVVRNQGDESYYYAACDDDCERDEPWPLVEVFRHPHPLFAPVGFSAFGGTHGNRVLSLDPQGRPRMLAQVRIEEGLEDEPWEAWWLFCDDGCTEIENWRFNTIYEVDPVGGLESEFGTVQVEHAGPGSTSRSMRTVRCTWPAMPTRIPSFSSKRAGR